MFCANGVSDAVRLKLHSIEGSEALITDLDLNRNETTRMSPMFSPAKFIRANFLNVSAIRTTLRMLMMTAAMCTIPIANAADERMSVDEFLERLGSEADSGNIRLPSMMPLIGSQLANQKSALDSRLEPTPFIIGGTTAPLNRYREYVLILITDAALEIVGACGGTMIAANKVLTAAHCSEEPAGRYIVIPGFYTFNFTPTRSDLFLVSRVARHPGYNPTTSANDAAVMTLARTYTQGVSAVLSGNDQLVGKLGTVTGTGLTSTDPQQSPVTLQEVEAPITSNASCNSRYAQLAGIRPIEPNMMCAGFLTDGRGSCSGDSGSPLFVDIDGQRVVSGVVSFGFGQCEFNRATNAYARATAVTDFIRSESPSTQFVESNDVSITSILGLLLLDDGGSTGNPPIVSPPVTMPSADSIRPSIPENFEGDYFLSIQTIPNGSAGQANKYDYTQLNSNIRFRSNFADGVTIDVDGAGVQNSFIIDSEDWGWDMSVARNNPRRLTAGVYDDAERFPFNDRVNGLSVSGLGSGCNQVIGRFRIFEIAYDGDQLSRLLADFEQRCSINGPLMIGSVDYDSSRADAAFPPATLPQGVPTPALPSAVTNGGVLIVEGTSGTAIVGSAGLVLDNSNSTFSFRDAGLNRVSIDIQTGRTSYSLEMKRSSFDIDPNRNLRLEVGHYPLATRSAFSAPLAGLSFSGNGSACNKSGGSFNIFEIAHDSSDRVVSLVADFKQTCRVDGEFLKGSIQVDLSTSN